MTVGEFDHDLFEELVQQLLQRMRAFPEWICRDNHLRAAAEKLEVERILTPGIVEQLIGPRFKSDLSEGEIVRLSSLCDSVFSHWAEAHRDGRTR
jgi:hypothetical protein